MASAHAARGPAPRVALALLCLGGLIAGGPGGSNASELAIGDTDPVPARWSPIEVRQGDDGVVAYRTRLPGGGPALPVGDAVLIDGEWWVPAVPLVAAPGQNASRAVMRLVRQLVAPPATRRSRHTLMDVTVGDVTDDGRADLVLAFRRPFRRNHINPTRPRRTWIDAHGLSAHVGVYQLDDLDEVWVAGTLVRPVVRLAACDGALAVAYGRLDAPGTVATSAWRWRGFGFLPVEALPGPGVPICVDIDGDGRTEAAVQRRSDR